MALSQEWALPLWVELRHLCFPCSSRSLLLHEVGTAASRFFWHCPAGHSLCRFSGWSQINCVFPDLLGAEHCHSWQLFWCRLGSTSAGAPSGRNWELVLFPQAVTAPAPGNLYPKGMAASQPLLGSHYSQVVS